MNARAILVWSAAALTVAIITTNPIYRALVALIALNVLLAHRRPETDLRLLARFMIVGGFSAILLNVLLSHAGDHPYVTLPPDLPGIGGPWTIESIVYGGDAALGLVAAMLAVAPLAYLLEPHQTVDALSAPLERTGIALAAALSLVPSIPRSFGEVREAQLMRGVRMTGLRALTDVLVPVALTAIERSMDLAEAMEARAFGSGRRTRYDQSTWSRRDPSSWLGP